MKRYQVCLLLLMPLAIFGQTESATQVELTDSINHQPAFTDSVKSNGRYSSFMIQTYRPAFLDSKYSSLTETLTYDMDSVIPTLNAPVADYIPGQASIYSWHQGHIAATGKVTANPGLMEIHTGAIGIFQQAGKMSFYVGGIANKYGYFNGVHTQYGINGNISYMLTPSLSFTAYGYYYFDAAPHMGNGAIMSPAIAGYYNISKFGGYADYRANDNFGVKVGGQTVQRIGTNRYKFEPIVSPYVKFQKFKIELPVGQILYGTIQSYRARRHHGR